MAFPSLSSVAIPAARIGFEAATLLDRMLSGQRVSSEVLFLPPVRSLVIALLGRNLKVVVVSNHQAGTVDLDRADWRRGEDSASTEAGDVRRLPAPSDGRPGNG